jgi:hypothetical protein
VVPQLPSKYTLHGLSAGLYAGTSALRMRVGAGYYKVEGRRVLIPNTTGFGVHAGIEKVVSSWERGSLTLGVRAVALPNIRGEWLWYVPLDVGIRVR